MPAAVETWLIHVERPGVVYVEQLPERSILFPAAIKDLTDEGVAQLLEQDGDQAILELTFKNGVARIRTQREHDDFGGIWFNTTLEDWKLTI